MTEGAKCSDQNERICSEGEERNFRPSTKSLAPPHCHKSQTSDVVKSVCIVVETRTDSTADPNHRTASGACRLCRQSV